MLLLGGASNATQQQRKKSLKFVVNLSGSRTSSLPFFPGFHDVAWLFRHQSALTWTLRPLLNPVIKFWYETQINYLGVLRHFFAHLKYLDALLLLLPHVFFSMKFEFESAMCFAQQQQQPSSMEWFRAYVEKSYHQIRRANWQLDFFLCEKMFRRWKNNLIYGRITLIKH